jgi:hypothetical protein
MEGQTTQWSKRIINYLQNTTQKTKDEAIGTPTIKEVNSGALER